MLSISSFAQGRFFFSTHAIKATESAQQQLRINNSQQAAQVVQRRYGGKVLRVQKQNASYRVKLIKVNGHIISVVVNAKTGRISGGN